MWSISEKEHVVVKFWFLNFAERSNWETKERMGE
jgi:hypothetical protein